jgi:hypothetical protein
MDAILISTKPPRVRIRIIGATLATKFTDIEVSECAIFGGMPVMFKVIEAGDQGDGMIVEIKHV